MRKGRVATQRSGKGQSEDGEVREPCTCSNSNFVSFVCRQCQELICVNCRLGEHKHHASNKINVVAGELRNDIGNKVSKHTKRDVSNFVQNGKQLIVKMRKELITKEIKVIDKIDKHVNKLHQQLDEIRNDLVKTVNAIVRKDIEYWKDAELDLDKSAQEIKLMYDAAQRILEKANDIEIIKEGYSICRSLKNISTTKVTKPTKGQAFSVQFVAGKRNRQSLQKMTGEISVQSGNDQADKQTTEHSQPTISVQPGNDQADKQTTEHSQPTISVQSENDQADKQTTEYSQPTISVQPGNDQADKQTTEHSQPTISVQSGNDQADKQTTEHSQPTMSEQLKHRQSGTKDGVEFVSGVSLSGVGVGILGVCATSDEKCLFTDRSPYIQLLDVTGTRHTPVVVGVWCLGITTDGSTMYVTCYDDHSIKQISTDNKVTNLQTSLSFDPAGLTFVPLTGELLVCGRTDGVYSVTESGVQKTLTDVKFQYAWDIAVNNNGDICVTDTNQIFIFNSDKRHVGTYDGHGTSIENKVDARGVTCDSRGNFIVVDCSNRVLHFINRDGDNVSIYDTTKDCEEKPSWIDISPSGRLWVSFGRNKICIYDMI